MAARFDNSFLEQQLKKRLEWNQRGVKTANGTAFSTNLTESKVISIESRLEQSDGLARSRRRSQATERKITAKQDIKLVDGQVPGWLAYIAENDSEIALALSKKGRGVTKGLSPFKSRLVQGIKKPELINSKQAEHWLQVRLFYTLEKNYPFESKFIFAIPNGGHRSKATAAMMSYEGQKKGTQDIFIPLPRGIYHGFFLEVKTKKGTASAEQREKAEMYKEQGYLTAIKKGFDECLAIIDSYLSLPPFDNKTTL